jgi:hypothetical protein
MFDMRPDGIEELREFKHHLNDIHNIKFTVRMEERGLLGLLDILVTKKSGGAVGLTMYRKST